MARFTLDSATVGGVPVPKSVLQELVAYYSQSESQPEGLNFEAPFRLPARIREIRTAIGPGHGRAVATRSMPASAEFLQTPLQFLKGVGPRKAADFARAGLHTIEDLLFRFPLRYEDRSRLQPIASLREGQTVSIAGEVITSGLRAHAASGRAHLRGAAARRLGHACASRGSTRPI